MAKCILTIEDDFKDGNPIIRGKFDVVDGPVSHDGSPVKFTPAQLYMTTVQRLWDAGSINTFVRMACPDMLYKNDMIQRQEVAAKEGAAANAPGAVNDVDKPAIDRAGAEDAHVLQNLGPTDPKPYDKPTIVAGVGKAKGKAVAALGKLAAADKPSLEDAAEQAGAGRGQPL